MAKHITCWLEKANINDKFYSYFQTTYSSSLACIVITNIITWHCSINLVALFRGNMSLYKFNGSFTECMLTKIKLFYSSRIWINCFTETSDVQNQWFTIYTEPFKLPFQWWTLMGIRLFITIDKCHQSFSQNTHWSASQWHIFQWKNDSHKH